MSDDDECMRIAWTILAAMQAAGYSGELAVADGQPSRSYGRPRSPDTDD